MCAGAIYPNKVVSETGYDKEWQKTAEYPRVGELQPERSLSESVFEVVASAVTKEGNIEELERFKLAPVTTVGFVRTASCKVTKGSGSAALYYQSLGDMSRDLLDEHRGVAGGRYNAKPSGEVLGTLVNVVEIISNQLSFVSRTGLSRENGDAYRAFKNVMGKLQLYGLLKAHITTFDRVAFYSRGGMVVEGRIILHTEAQKRGFSASWTERKPRVQIERDYVWTDSSTEAMVDDMLVAGSDMAEFNKPKCWEKLVRILISEGTLSLKKILGAKNPADMLTKVFSTDRAVWHEPEQFSSELNNISLPCLYSLFVRAVCAGAIYRTEVCTEVCAGAIYPNKVVSEPGYDKQWQKTCAPLRYRYPHLFALETCKNCPILGRRSLVDGVWEPIREWRQQPIGRSAGDVSLLTSFLNGLVLDPSHDDKWVLSLESSDKFTVKSLSLAIKKKLLVYDVSEVDQ
ncbi:hypothetical protein Tco_0878118 [Tanacetum coccineum]|uniref:Uncharacterized protein n=1 Tax=Tanacetum coccineum TaxID=301880 RepID=A0ABQ5C009_9ASTR